jgi:hypothetical protein
VTYQPGETVIVEGSKTDRLLILKKGTVAIVREDTEIRRSLRIRRGGRISRSCRGRSPLRLKVKNPKAPAVKREAEVDWGVGK